MSSCRILSGLKRNSSRKVAYYQAFTGPASLAQSAKFRTWEKVMNLLHTSKPVKGHTKKSLGKKCLSDFSDFVIQNRSDLISHSAANASDFYGATGLVCSSGTWLSCSELGEQKETNMLFGPCSDLYIPAHYRAMLFQILQAKRQLKFQLGPAMHQRSKHARVRFRMPTFNSQ